MSRALPMLILATLLGCRSSQPVAADPFRPVRFLAGCWRAERDGSTTEEIWTAPYGDTMYGQNRTLRGGKQVFFELLSIERRGDALVYVARPGGDPPTDFTMTAASDDSVTFENPEHDFPKRITYRLGEGGNLLATVDDGTDAGKRIEFAWQPVPPTAAAR